MDELYNKAISFYNEGRYEEVLDLIGTSSIAASKKGQNLIQECKKLILEQYVYLIKEYVEQQDYLNALRKKEEYRTKYGAHAKIENIPIPSSPIIDQETHSEQQTSNNQNQQTINKKLPLCKKVFSLNRKWFIISAIITLTLISFLGYGSYKSTTPQSNKVYEDSIYLLDSLAALELAAQECESQGTINQEEESNVLEESSSEVNSTASSIIDVAQYSGMIDRKYLIDLNLVWRESGEITGNYYYVKNGSNAILQLSGSINSDDYMILKEYNSVGEHTGTFEGKWHSDTYSGTFTNYRGIKMPFSLVLKSE